MRLVIQCLRNFFKAGKYRTSISWGLFFSGLIIFILYGEIIFCGIHQDFLTGTATLAAMLTLITYNLRCRMTDYLLKIIPNEDRYKSLLSQADCCAKTLTNIALLSFFTSFLAILSKCFPLNLWMLSITGALFLVCLNQYLHVLFSFENVEDLLLKNTKEEREKKMREEKERKEEERRQRYPDN